MGATVADMNRFLCIASISLSIGFAGETSVKMKDLPPAVQKTVQEQTKGAQIKGLSKEVEKGKTTYEVETTVNGKSRDLLIDLSGALVSVEEPVAIGTIPAAARATMERLAGGERSRASNLSQRGRQSPTKR